MKKNRDLATHLTKFLSYYLPEIRNLSSNTISSYCDTFRLLLEYCRDVEGMKVEKLMISDLTAELVERFLYHLATERRIKDSTRNQRLAAIHSFVRYIQTDFPEFLLEFCKILDIKAKKIESKTVNWLTKEEMGNVLNAPDPTSKMGRRNITIMTLLYDTGARVSEICELRVRDIRLEHPAHARLFGKGRKIRLVPLLPETVKLLEMHIKENRLNLPEKSDYPLFVNRDGDKFTRSGINYILNQASTAASHGTGRPPKHCSPHMIRHTKAMHVYDAGANIVYVRDILGHADAKTTSIYARTSLEKKREALAKVSDVAEPTLPTWTKDPDMLDWLKDYGKVKK